MDGGAESAAEGGEGGEGGEGAARAAKAAKAEALKELASSLMRGAEMGRALACLAEAIALAPWLASLYTNRAHIFETLHRSEEALLDAEQAISLAPDWPKAHLRAARSMISLERHGEALAALEAALRHAPGAPVLMEAAAEARLLLRMQRRDESALASTSSVGDTDLVGIPRGRCCARTKVGAGGSGAGEECACPAYVQRHRSMKIQLDGRWGSPRTCPALAPHLPRTCPALAPHLPRGAPAPLPALAVPPGLPAPASQSLTSLRSSGRSDTTTSPSCSCAFAAAMKHTATSTSSTREIASSTREIDSHRHASTSLQEEEEGRWSQRVGSRRALGGRVPTPCSWRTPAVRWSKTRRSVLPY